MDTDNKEQTQEHEELVKKAREKVMQIEQRRAAERRGTRGRAEHKDGAQSSNKPSGGKMAR